MTREELYHHTDAQLSDYVRRAVVVVNELELDPADRAAVLPVLVQLASAKTINFEQIAPRGVPLLARGGNARR